MSFHQGKRGEKIRRLWVADKNGEKDLRDWLAQNGFPQLSLTIFTYLAHYEQARAKFLRAHTARKRKKFPPNASPGTTAGGAPSSTAQQEKPTIQSRS